MENPNNLTFINSKIIELTNNIDILNDKLLLINNENKILQEEIIIKKNLLQKIEKSFDILSTMSTAEITAKK